MDIQELKLWRREQRRRLVAVRLAVDAAQLESWRQSIDPALTLRGEWGRAFA